MSTAAVIASASGIVSSGQAASEVALAAAHMRSQTAAISSAWRSTAQASYAWRPCQNNAGALSITPPGEAGGLFVECDAVPNRRAYMKPRKRDETRTYCRAAREKIAADLAHDVGVVVPPVVLARREKVQGDEEFVSVSLVLYRKQWPWDMVRDFVASPPSDEIGAIVRAPLGRSAAQAFVFDTWVDQTDHNDHPHNIIFGYDDDTFEGASYVFLDYAFAFGCRGSWENEGFKERLPAPFPPLMLEKIDKFAVSETISRIQSLGADAISDVVNRVPDRYLPDAQKPLIIEGLMARRALLGGALAPHLPGGAP